MGDLRVKGWRFAVGYATCDLDAGPRDLGHRDRTRMIIP
jgi:hypothetical protein